MHSFGRPPLGQKANLVHSTNGAYYKAISHNVGTSWFIISLYAERSIKKLQIGKGA